MYVYFTLEQKSNELAANCKNNICSLIAWPLCLREEWTSSKFLHMKEFHMKLSSEAVKKMTTQQDRW